MKLTLASFHSFLLMAQPKQTSHRGRIARGSAVPASIGALEAELEKGKQMLFRKQAPQETKGIENLVKWLRNNELGCFLLHEKSARQDIR